MNELNMILSGITEKDGKKRACVRFEDGKRYAEGYIPDCKINSQAGFSAEEIKMLEDYLTNNLADLKKQAASIDPILSILRG